jgi:hypothetical protein
MNREYSRAPCVRHIVAEAGDLNSQGNIMPVNRGIKFHATCVYCSQQYLISSNHHKLTRCPNYPLSPRASCGYCDAVLKKGLAYAEHLIRECERVPGSCASGAES